MRIRKRSMLPFISLPSSLNKAPNLPQQQHTHRRESRERERDRSDGRISHDERNRSFCMLPIPIPQQVEAMKGEEEEEEDGDEKRWGARETITKSNQWAGEAITAKEKKRKNRRLRKTNFPKKLDSEEYGKEEANGESENVKKRGTNGDVVMEGSRCSRVNGRGWRCWQQTLVGYSLCDHHLGKGRLRSITTVRGHTSSLKNSSGEDDDDNNGLPSTPKIHEEDDENLAVDEEEEEEKLTSMVMKKKKKKKMRRNGMVKARSISSLLGQTHHATPAIPVPTSGTASKVMV